MKVTLNQRHHGTLPPPRRGTTPDTSKLAEINPLADSKHATLHAEVLAAAQELDYKEHSMYGYIERLKSIEEAVKKFGRL